ncbi:MAG: DHH family phosphoesterase [Candidatus Kerfeldbacteria bacterium]|nr:DHH family phosphoesterase [Candidatus Kerfeldbacteria bacterium]
MDPFQTLTTSQRHGVIIHHWDTDGLCSAAVLFNYLAERFPEKKLTTFVPTITNYYLTAQQLQQLSDAQYQFAITCDINFPEQTVNGLARVWPDQTYIFDHHHQTPYRQVHYFNQPHPACASFITATLGLANNLLAAIAMVGDREESIQQDTQYYPWVAEMMQQYNISFAQLLTLRRLIDSNYMVDDYSGMHDTIQLLRHDPLALLTDVKLENNLQQIGGEIDRLLEQAPQALSNQVLFLDLHTSLNILSHVTRNISRQYPDKIIFTRQLKADQYTCYIRRRQLQYDMRQLIQFARDLGLNAGGKEEVVGIIIPREQLNEIFPKLQAKVASIQV